MAFLKNIPLYIPASIITSCVAMSFGLDTGTIGPVTTMPSYIETFGEFSATIHGVIVSSILIPGALAALAAGILADRYGRIRVVQVGSAIFGIGAAVECAAPLLGVFILGRVIKGIGEGLFLSAVYVQVSEISPARIRGIMTSVPQFLITTGLVLGYFICYGTARMYTSSASWRVPLGIMSAFAFLSAGLCMFVPESPRWLLAAGQTEKAREIVAKLGLEPAEQQELLSQNAALEHAPDQTVWESLKGTVKDFGEAFSPPFRARTLFGSYLLFSQQLSGIDGVLLYSPVLFKQAGLSSAEASFLASGVSALVIFATTIPATLFADKWSRRTSSIVGGTAISALMFLMGSLYAAGQVQADSGPGRWVVVVSIYLFAIVFSATWAIGFRTFLIESMPRKTRASASSLAQSANWVANYIVALTTPILIDRSTFGAYYFFAIATLLCTIVIVFFMNETRGHSLEAIERQYIESRSKATGVWSEALKLRKLNRSHAGAVGVVSVVEVA